MALINKLENIAAAIREKTGKTDLLTLEQMPIEIAAIETGGGSAELPEEAFKISGDCQYRFSGNGWNWFLENYSDKITTEALKRTDYMFYENKELEEIPFDFNFDNSNYRTMQNMFYYCPELTKIGKIINAYPENLQSLFNTCGKLRELPEFINLNLDRIRTYAYSNVSQMFNSCYSLRRISEDFLKQIYGIWTSNNYPIFNNGFASCYVLDEIRGLNPQTGAITSNMFGGTFGGCNRLKEIIFLTQEDGTPYSVNWKNQTINLVNPNAYSSTINPVGVGVRASNLTTTYNSGITADKEVKDDATYQALKNDPDWFTCNVAYSRYNHDSAVNTINSLPDVTQGSGNSIKLYGAAGSATDGGAINTLTEEEIAVATAKGWTVTLV